MHAGQMTSYTMRNLMLRIVFASLFPTCGGFLVQRMFFICFCVRKRPRILGPACIGKSQFPMSSPGSTMGGAGSVVAVGLLALEVDVPVLLGSSLASETIKLDVASCSHARCAVCVPLTYPCSLSAERKLTTDCFHLKVGVSFSNWHFDFLRWTYNDDDVATQEEHDKVDNRIQAKLEELGYQRRTEN